MSASGSPRIYTIDGRDPADIWDDGFRQLEPYTRLIQLYGALTVEEVVASIRAIESIQVVNPLEARALIVDVVSDYSARFHKTDPVIGAAASLLERWDGSTHDGDNEVVKAKYDRLRAEYKEAEAAFDSQVLKACFEWELAIVRVRCPALWGYLRDFGTQSLLHVGRRLNFKVDTKGDPDGIQG